MADDDVLKDLQTITESTASDNDFAKLLETAMEKLHASPAFKSALERRAKMRPVPRVLRIDHDIVALTKARWGAHHLPDGIKKGFVHWLRFEIEGKAGEIKTLAKRPSETQLLLFRGTDIYGWDSATEPGTGTRVLDVKIGGQRQIPHYPGPYPTKNLLRSTLSRGVLLDLLHPRLKAEVTVEFLQDCTFKLDIPGSAIEVPNEGYYTFEPVVACTRAPSAEMIDPVRNKLYGVQGNGRQRCEHCWFEWDRHAKWPWRELKLDVSAELVEPGKAIDIKLPAANLVMPNVAIWSEKLYGEMFSTNSEIFSTPGFATATRWPKFVLSSEKPFNHYNNGELIVPAGEEYILRVRNKSEKARSFKGEIRAHELALV